MPRRRKVQQPVTNDATELKNRLEETEETLHAIRQYLVDAFVVTRANGEQVVTLNDADFPYRMMVESMNEGAVTLIPDGTIFYCNPRLAEMVQTEHEKLIGVRFQDLIHPEEQADFEQLFKGAGQEGARGEFRLRTMQGSYVPVQLSVCQLAAEDVRGIAVIATDITERKDAEKKIRSLASKLTMAEQEERHRISQVLHDDLQQRLFAIKAQLSLLNEITDKGHLPPGVQRDLTQLQSWLTEAINITRNLSIDMSPAVLHGEGLLEVITWLSSQMKEQYGLQVQIESQEDFKQVDQHMRVLLFQTVRELLFNVVKHAGTLEAHVNLAMAGSWVRITVSDNGKGFERDTVISDSQIVHGLRLVQERLGLIGCKLEINSAVGAGTRVVIDAPMARE